MKLRLAALIAIAMPVAIYAHLAAAQDNAAPSAKPTKPVVAPAPDSKASAVAPKQKKTAALNHRSEPLHERSVEVLGR